MRAAKIVIKEHWNRIYKEKDFKTLGWYQDNPEPDISTILELKLSLDSKILFIGAGISTLTTRLYKAGYQKMILTDISKEALDKLKDQIDVTSKNTIRWIIDDVTQPNELQHLENIELWYDRAVLHFFTNNEEREKYSHLLQNIKPRYVFLAQFSINGAEKCSGLDIYHYDLEKMKEIVGQEYELIKTFDHIYINPSGGQRPYIYALFRHI